MHKTSRDWGRGGVEFKPTRVQMLEPSSPCGESVTAWVQQFRLSNACAAAGNSSLLET